MTEPTTRTALRVNLPITPNAKLTTEHQHLGRNLFSSFKNTGNGLVTPTDYSDMLNFLVEAVAGRLISVLTVITEDDVTKAVRHLHPEGISEVTGVTIKGDVPCYRVSCTAGDKKYRIIETPHKEVADLALAIVTVISTTPYVEDAVAARGVSFIIDGVVEVEVTEEAEDSGSDICECGRDHEADMATAKNLLRDIKVNGASIDDILDTLNSMGIHVGVFDIGNLRDL